MIGIYSWKNLITGEMYIGQSLNIENRKKGHIRAHYNILNKTKLYTNMRKYGIENFEFNIIEECLPEELNEKEQYYIKYYNTYPNQLNSTPGGTSVQGANNPNTLLTNDDVLSIRNRVYKNNEEIMDVYEDYSEKISEYSFWSLVHGDTWTSVDCSMIYSLKERGYKNFTGSKNLKACLKEEDVVNIRIRHSKGEESLNIYKDYQSLISYSAFTKIIQGQTWKNICPELYGKEVKIQREGKPKAKLTKEDVLRIRELSINGISNSEIYKQFSQVTPKTIQRVINRETWKNI